MDLSWSKRRYALIPTSALALVADVMLVGAAKYSENGWKLHESELFWDAAMRHLSAYRAGFLLDTDDGLPHLAHAAADILIALAIDIHEGKHGTHEEIHEGPLPQKARARIAKALAARTRACAPGDGP